MLFILGDIHGNMTDLKQAVRHIPPNSPIILLGDAGINYDGAHHDRYVKQTMAAMPYLFYMVHGNHEERPSNIPSYKELPVHKNTMWVEDQYPNLFFLNDGEYSIAGHSVLVLGGAYSVDKHYRLARGAKWFPSEQMSMGKQQEMLNLTAGKSYDIVLSHTCPYNARPLHRGLSFVNQNEIDDTMEHFLQQIHDQIAYKKWYAGHWHTDELFGGIHFLYKTPQMVTL